MGCPRDGGRSEARSAIVGVAALGWEQAMVTIVAGPALTKFSGHAQPQQSLPGPGSNAYQMIPETDLTTWLVAPGVFDCAILTIILGTTRPGGAVIAGHRPGGDQVMARGYIRAMAHFNPFSGPRAPAIAELFHACLAGQTATVNDMIVAISFNAGAHRPYTNRLATVVGEAVPALQSLTTHGYGVASPEGQSTKPVTIYLSPTGRLSASQ
jgi:hypothetical protein